MDPTNPRYIRFDDPKHYRLAEEAVQRHKKRLYRILSRTIRCPEDVDDVFVTVWNAALRGWPNCRDKENPAPWLDQIARNAAISYLRKERSLQRVTSAAEAASLLLPVADEYDDPEAVFDRALQAETVRDAIDTLPDTQRLAVLLRYFHDFSFDQIAFLVRKTRKAIESLLDRARATLREQLNEKMRTKR